MDFIPAVSAGLQSPRHLAPMVELIERAHKGSLRVCIAVPCQHGKSTVVLHAIPWLLLRNPDLSIFYATYGQTFSGRQSRTMRRIAASVGVDISEDHNTIQEWRTGNDGGLLATSVDGEGTGRPAHVVFIDDPYKNREDAENPEYRAKVEDWLSGVIVPRLAPGGSIFVVASRWHDEDLSGYCIRKKGYKEIRLAALNDDGSDPGRELGAALCPWGPDPDAPRDVAFLEGLRKEIGEYDWESLYQGRPRPRAGAVFRDATFFDELPKEGRTVALGFDLAHSAGPMSDWTVIAKVVRVMRDGLAHYYVDDVQRWRSSMADSEDPIRKARAENPGAKLVWYLSPLEKGMLQQFAMLKPPIFITPLGAWSSKYVRAQKTSRLWNTGRVLVREGAEWVSVFLSEICGFTGDEKTHDDQVDALCAAIDYLETTSGTGATRSPLGGRRRI